MSPNLLVYIEPGTRSLGEFKVVVHSTDGRRVVALECISELDAIALRSEIRQHVIDVGRIDIDNQVVAP